MSALYPGFLHFMERLGMSSAFSATFRSEADLPQAVQSATKGQSD